MVSVGFGWFQVVLGWFRVIEGGFGWLRVVQGCLGWVFPSGAKVVFPFKVLLQSNQKSARSDQEPF